MSARAYPVFSAASLRHTGQTVLCCVPEIPCPRRVAGEPTAGLEILAWRSAHEMKLPWNDETFFADTVLLVPAVKAIYRSLKGPDRPWAAFGFGAFAAVVPINFALLIVQQRLACPVYGVGIDDPAVIALVVSFYYGGMHAVSLLLAGASVMLGLTIRRGTLGSGAGAIGVAARVAQIIAA